MTRDDCGRSPPTPLISIVIPCYNYGRYLSEAVESALAQTYVPTEILIINDGSTDNTEEVAHSYLSRGIRYIHQTNQGPSATRNRGALLAKGDFLIFLDADDRLDPSYLSACFSALAGAPPEVGFVYTQMELFGAKNSVTSFPEYSIHTLRFGNYIHISSLLKKSLVLHYPFNEHICAREDWDFFLTLAEKKIEGLLLNKPLLYYRQHHDIISRESLLHKNPKLANQLTLQIMRAHPKLYSRKEKVKQYLKYWIKNIFWRPCPPELEN